MQRFLPLFTSAQDVYNNACVNWFHDPLELYATAYKEAAEKLVKDVITSRRQRDTLVYPIVFLYRHYIELRLKEIIRAGRKFLDEPGDFPKHHRVRDQAYGHLQKELSRGSSRMRKISQILSLWEHLRLSFPLRSRVILLPLSNR